MLNPSIHIEQTNYTSHNPIIKALLANFVDKICETLTSIGATTKRGIDAGCGEAHMLGRLHARGVLGDIVAVDVNSQYLAYAAEKYPNYDFLTADLIRLPFGDHTFDYVISTEVFEHLKDPTRAILELKRIGKKNAYLIISVPFEPFFHLGNIARGKYWNRGGYTQTTAIYGVGMILENFLLLLSISKENLALRVSHGCSMSVDSSRESNDALAVMRNVVSAVGWRTVENGCRVRKSIERTGAVVA